METTCAAVCSGKLFFEFSYAELWPAFFGFDFAALVIHEARKIVSQASKPFSFWFKR